MDQIISDLASTVARQGKEGLTSTATPNVRLSKVSRCVDLLPETYRPAVSLILQGEKQLAVGDQVLNYTAGRTFTTALDLPVMAKNNQRERGSTLSRDKSRHRSWDRLRFDREHA